MELVTKNTSDLIPYVNNSRTHSEEQINQIISSIKEFGFTNPVLIESDNGIIAGHGRIMAAKKMGLKEVPCVMVKGLTKTQIKALNIADNQIALNAGWDLDKLKLEIQGLNEDSFNLDTLGFTKNQIDDFLFEETVGLTDEDETPEIKENPKSKLGDIWLLGNHKIMCGDCTLDENKNNLLKDKNIDMIFTDPPYGVDYVSRVDEERRKNWGGIKNDNLKGNELVEFLKKSLDWFENTYIFCNWQSYPDFINAYGKPKQVIVWNKKWVGLGKGYRNQYEMCLFYGTLNITTETNLWDIKRDSNYKHPTQKPVALSVRAITNSLLVNRICYDPFLGSGSTLLGCEKTNRICYGFELEPKYIDVIIERWQNFTGKEAIHEQTGKRYNEL